MKGSEARHASAEALRLAFDRAFAEPAGGGDDATEDLLAVRLSGEAYALRLGELGGLYAARRIAALPRAVPELLGLAALRGSLVAVYDLRVLLGYAGGASPRWIAAARQDATVGLAFDEVDGTLRLAAGDITPRAAAASPADTALHLREVARAGDLVRPLIDVASVLTTIRNLARAGGHQEHER